MKKKLTPEDKYLKKVHSFLDPNDDNAPFYCYLSQFGYCRSYIKPGIEFVLKDGGETLFNISSPAATILYSLTKKAGKNIYIFLTELREEQETEQTPEDIRFCKAFESLMRRYRKEYRKYFLRKYITRRVILYEKTKLPRDILDYILAYM